MLEQPASSVEQIQKPAVPTRWLRITGWLPVIFIGLIILTGNLTPGESFFEGQQSGIYLQFKHNAEIVWYLSLGMVAAATIAVIAFVGCLILRQPTRLRDTLLAVLSLFIIGGAVLSTFVIPEFLIIYWHKDTSSTAGHTYHLASQICWVNSPGCSQDDLLTGVRYFVIDCGAMGIICHRVYASEPLNMEARQGKYRPEFKQDESSGRLQLVDGDAVLWQSP